MVSQFSHAFCTVVASTLAIILNRAAGMPRSILSVGGPSGQFSQNSASTRPE